MILYRCFAWDERAPDSAQDGPLWFPRVFQGEGRHDNPDLYGCLYVADRAVSCVIEQLARFRGQRLRPSLLRRRGLPLGLAELEFSEDGVLIDLDEPRTLQREKLRPSAVATRRREITQSQARGLYEKHGQAAGLAWWSVHESLWKNLTLFERASPLLQVGKVRALTIEDPAVIDAARFFELRLG
jgi:hypothetical protein